jgi:hypothetical protein
MDACDFANDASESFSFGAQLFRLLQTEDRRRQTNETFISAQRDTISPSNFSAI